MNRLGIITGLASEIRCLSLWRGNPEIEITCAGANPRRAAELAESLAERGCGGLVSLGIAGGLDETVSTGDLVLPGRVVCDGQSWPCSEPWRSILEKKLVGGPVIHSGGVAGSPSAVSTAVEKAELRRNTGAIATDMESYALAAVAARRDLPFLVVRVVADPWDQGIPAWMPGLIDEQGDVRMLHAIVSLLAHPGDWGEVGRLRRQNRQALESLGRVAVLAGPLFGFADLGR